VRAKAAKIVGVLVTQPSAWYERTLAAVGFRSVAVLNAKLGFVTWLARKPSTAAPPPNAAAAAIAPLVPSSAVAPAASAAPRASAPPPAATAPFVAWPAAEPRARVAFDGAASEAARGCPNFRVAAWGAPDAPRVEFGDGGGGGAVFGFVRCDSGDGGGGDDDRDDAVATLTLLPAGPSYALRRGMYFVAPGRVRVECRTGGSGGGAGAKGGKQRRGTGAGTGGAGGGLLIAAPDAQRALFLLGGPIEARAVLTQQRILRIVSSQLGGPIEARAVLTQQRILQIVSSQLTRRNGNGFTPRRRPDRGERAAAVHRRLHGHAAPLAARARRAVPQLPPLPGGRRPDAPHAPEVARVASCCAVSVPRERDRGRRRVVRARRIIISGGALERTHQQHCGGVVSPDETRCCDGAHCVARGGVVGPDEKRWWWSSRRDARSEVP